MSVDKIQYHVYTTNLPNKDSPTPKPMTTERRRQTLKVLLAGVRWVSQRVRGREGSSGLT